MKKNLLSIFLNEETLMQKHAMYTSLLLSCSSINKRCSQSGSETGNKNKAKAEKNISCCQR